MKTIYTVEILYNKYGNRWYSEKVGQQFEAELVTKVYSDWEDGTRPAFKVDALRSINPNHCKVISEVKIQKKIN